MPTAQPLPHAEFAFPGPLRDKLVAAILAGVKTSTTSLVVGYERDGEPLPKAGDQSVLVDSADQPVAVLENTEVTVLPLCEVGARHAVDEGEGHTTVEEWRLAHEEFWHGQESRAALGDPQFTVGDDTLVVAERFRVLRLL